MAQPESTLILLPEISKADQNPCIHCHYMATDDNCIAPGNICCVTDADTSRYSVALMEYSDVQT
jgi:hypothetical protein